MNDSDPHKPERCRYQLRVRMLLIAVLVGCPEILYQGYESTGWEAGSRGQPDTADGG